MDHAVSPTRVSFMTTLQPALHTQGDQVGFVITVHARNDVMMVQIADWPRRRRRMSTS